MEKEKIEKELDNNEVKEKKNKKSVNPLIIIIILVTLLLIVGGILLVTRKDAKDVYLNIIDKGVESGYELIETYFDEVDNNQVISGGLKFEMNDGGILGQDGIDLINIINEIDINYVIEVSNRDKHGNVSFDLDYKNNDLINLDMMLKDQDMFINLGSLYGRNIKISGEELDLTWNNNMEVDFKVFLNEFSRALKNNLKREYFDKDSETLIINSKDVKANKFILNLNGQNIYDLKLNMLEELKNNENFINSLMVIGNSTKEEVLTYLEEYKNELKLDTNESLVIEICLSKKNELLKLSIGNYNERKSIVKSTDNKYDITSTKNNITDVVGYVELKEDAIELNYDDNNTKLNMNIKDDNITFNMSEDSLEINYVIEENNDTVKFSYEFIIKDSGIELKVTLDGEGKEVSSITNKDVSNYVVLEEMTEDDLMTIYENFYNNNTLMTLVEDIMVIYNRYAYDGYYSDDDLYYDDYYSVDNI